MNLHVDRLDNSKAFPSAIMYGPVAMAVNVTEEYHSDIVDEKKLSSNFIPISNKPLNYTIKDHSDLILRPYYQFALHEPYILYVDTVARNYVLIKNVQFKGDWQKGRGPYFSKDKNASVGTAFTGNGIAVSLVGNKSSVL